MTDEEATMADGEALAVERVRSLAEPVLARHEAELVDLIVKRGRTQIVRLTVDREQGIDLETCAKISDQLSRMLDADDPIPGRYTLEVTSPGIDRPLRSERDFHRNVGRPLRAIAAGHEHEGSLEEVQPGRIKLRTKSGDEWLDIDAITSAKVILPW